MNTAIATLAASSAALVTACASAALVEFGFATATPSVTDPRITATDFTASGVAGLVSGGAFRATGWNNDYVTSAAQGMGFSATTASFATATLASITFDITADGFFYYNGYDLRLAIVANGTTEYRAINPINSRGEWLTNQTISLGNLAIGAGQTVTFRFEGYNNGDPPSDYIALDNVRLNGTLVPAPGAIALVGIGALVGRRRRDR